MPTLDGYDPILNTGILFQGPPGAGKTTLAAQFPKPHIIDADNNLAGCARYLRANKPDQLAQVKYDIVNVDEKGALVPPRDRYTRFKSLVTKAASDPDVQTLIVDSATYISDYIIGDIQRQNSRKENEFQQTDWNAYLWAWKNLITQLRSVPGKMFILTAHERPEKDDADGIIKYFIALPGQIRDTIGGLFTDVWRMEVEEALGSHKFVIRTMPNARLILKKSFPTMPAKLDAKYEEIVKYLTGTK